MATNPARQRMLMLVVVSALGAALTTSCRPSPTRPAEELPTILGPENVAVVERQRVEAGPLVSGSLEARSMAVLRAEASGSVDEVTVELGDAVKAGQLLVRIEDQGQRDALASAASALQAARADHELARRQVERSRRLVAAGALSQENLEQAETAASAARARVAQAQAQVVSSRKQLEGSSVRAPFAGVVSERAVSAGDVVTPGTPLVTVIDPTTMRLQASVPSEQIGLLAKGQEVDFEVRGYPAQPFSGRIDRIAPAAQAATRQVTVLVEIPNPSGRLVAGLFAEGRIVVSAREALVVPFDALLDTAESPSVLRVQGAGAETRLEAVPITLGLRDERRERVEVTSGLEDGDVVVVGPARSLKPGAKVQVGTSLAAARAGGR